MSKKLYWGLDEVELNRFWKSIEKHKNNNSIFLSLEEPFTEPYEYYLEKVKLIEPNFTEEMLINVCDDMIYFRDEDKTYTDYYDYKAAKQAAKQKSN